MLAKSFRISISRSRVNVLLLLLIAFKSCVCREEYFSSVESLQQLVKIEMTLMSVFRQYVLRQERVLAEYKNFLEQVIGQHKLIQKDAEAHFGNPINVFNSINRFFTDWYKIRKGMKQKNVFSQTFKRLKFLIPEYAELRGAAMTMVRLQKVYNLKTIHLANGLINGIDYGTPLYWHECYEIAETLLKEKELPYAIYWFRTTVKILLQKNYNPSHEIDLPTYLALENLNLVLQADTDKALKISVSSTAEDTNSLTTEYWAQDLSFSNYSRLCQGIRLPEKVHHTLKCTLETQNNPVFVLAPLKKEEISVDPEITLYHDILNDAQIDKILSSAAGRKRTRSKVKDDTEEGISDFRVSQQTWLDNLPIKKKIDTVLNDITGFNISNSEAIQVVSYASGGVFEPHFDNLGLIYSDRWPGDRISTNVFYLSSVEQGGYTVFPYLNIYLRPERGSLVTWYNMHRSLDKDARLLHAGCPVIKGSKRIANVWIHSGFQEFARPCGLINDADKSKEYEMLYSD